MPGADLPGADLPGAELAGPDLLTVRYFAGARAAAGRAEEQLPAGVDLADLLGTLATRHGPGLAKVLAAASFLVDGTSCRDHSRTLRPGAVVDVLPPFAGG